MPSFNQLFPSEAKSGPNVGEPLTKGILANLDGEIYAYTSTPRAAIANDITANPHHWQLLSGVGRMLSDGTLRQQTKFWSGLQADYDAINTKDPDTIYWVTDN